MGALNAAIGPQHPISISKEGRFVIAIRSKHPGATSPQKYVQSITRSILTQGFCTLSSAKFTPSPPKPSLKPIFVSKIPNT